MKFKFRGKRLGGVLTVIPKDVRSFDEEMGNYTATSARMKRLKEVMGYGEHRIIGPETCVSDMAAFGTEQLFARGLLKKEEIGALLLVTDSPDYYVPPTSNVVQGRLGLPEDVYCLDMNQGCCGYVVGLLQAFQILEHMGNKKVLLVVGTVGSRKVSPKDRKTYPLAGDAVSVSVVENCDEDSEIFVEMRMDGTRADAIIVPAGGFRMPCTPETAIEHEDEDGNIRCLNNIVMKGGEVFNFMQVDVPPLIEDILQMAGKAKEEIDWFLFHQPNKFMVEKLADTLEIPQEKMPSNIVSHFGNASGATIPTNICFNLADEICKKSFDVCLSGFGVGLAWGAIVMKLGPLRFCEFAEY